MFLRNIAIGLPALAMALFALSLYAAEHLWFTGGPTLAEFGVNASPWVVGLVATLIFQRSSRRRR